MDEQKDQPDAAFLEACRKIGTSTWSDALDELKVGGVMRGLTQRAGAGRFAGYAVTVRERAGQLGAFPKSDMAVGRFLDATAQGQVLVVDVGSADLSTFGGLAAFAASRKGLAAVVIDGGCRDLDEIRATPLWLASRHVTPMSGKTRIRTESIGEPVSAGGVTVCQGDLIIGDETGIVVVPQAHIARVMAAAQAEVAVDQKVEADLRAGLSFAEAAAKARYL